MPDKAPVDAVGGPQNDGPWPDGVDEIVQGNSYQRPVQLSDGSVTSLEVVVTEVQQIVDSAGNPTDGYVVSYQYDDPTLDGGSL